MLTLQELKKRRIVMPDQPIPEEWRPGDIMSFNHGPRVPNVFAFEFMNERDSEGRPRSRLLEKEEHELLSPWIVEFVSRELARHKVKTVAGDIDLLRLLFYSRFGWGQKIEEVIAEENTELWRAIHRRLNPED
jgi:hypothetical protein